MPTYNEAGNVPGMVELLMNLDLPGLRLLIVDDSSPDGTGKIAEELAEKFRAEDGSPRISVMHRVTKDGLGRAYAAGMSKAVEDGAQYVLQMDADGSHPADKIAGMLGVALSTGSGLVVGSRYVPGGTLSEAWGAHRKLLSRWANAYASTVLGTRLRDITGGFNMWSAEALRVIDLASVGSAGYSFQVEMKYTALRRGVQAMEVPIHFEDRTIGESKMSLAVQLESAVMPWKLRRSAARPRPGAPAQPSGNAPDGTPGTCRPEDRVPGPRR
ncbi:polyprenol monophosphomannose synthase [Streptomyces sp. NPDC085524]|uniref:polyprenol monophosphomannose synthase n=1 Tax=Streptomyces sp. NPDC085524 TaxID=3365728 RepID=UPI0037D33AB2